MVHRMSDRQVATSTTHWREQINAYQAELELLRPQLIDAESSLAELLVEISAFEFLVRSKLERLAQRVAKLEQEVNELRRQLRMRRFAWESEDGFEAGQNGRADQWEFAREAAASAGNFRYREQPAEFTPPTLATHDQAELRQLYRQLARRFHPDLGVDEADRARRTAIMMSINTAYTAGDLKRLHQLALEPDSTPNVLPTEAELAESLGREVERCRSRLAEIATELAELEKHESSQLLRRSQRATAEGRDLLDELAADLRRRVNEKLVEKDALQTQLDEQGSDEEPGSDSLADVLYDLGLEQAGDSAFITEFNRWRAAKNQRWTDEWSEDDIEDILDDFD